MTQMGRCSAPVQFVQANAMIRSLSPMSAVPRIILLFSPGRSQVCFGRNLGKSPVSSMLNINSGSYYCNVYPQSAVPVDRSAILTDPDFPLKTTEGGECLESKRDNNECVLENVSRAVRVDSTVSLSSIVSLMFKSFAAKCNRQQEDLQMVQSGSSCKADLQCQDTWIYGAFLRFGMMKPLNAEQ